MKKSERGAVLLLVLAVVVILSALAIDIAARSAADAMHASRARRDAAFRRLFDSGAEVARAVLAKTPLQSYTFWGEAWNEEQRFGLGADETAAVRTADENGKINVARTIRAPEERSLLLATLQRLFDYLKRHDPHRGRPWPEMARAVIDRLNSPQPLLTLDGFRETGLTTEQVFGADGLARYLTCFGDGAINVNTAPRPVLFAILKEADEPLVDRISAFRGKKEGDPGSYRPFEEPRDLLEIDGVILMEIVDGEPRVVHDLGTKFQGALTTRSSAFSVRIDAQAGGKKRQAWAFLRPGGDRLAFEEIEP